jgi:PAS domain S-box-containing protein
MKTFTERKQTEEGLRVAEMRYRSFYEKSRDALMTLDPSSGLFTSANPSAIAMFGARDEADFVSRALWQYSSVRQPNGRDSAELAKETIETAVRDGYRCIEWTCAKIDGTEFPATILLTRFECAGETILQATVRDIALEKRTVVQQAAAEEELLNSKNQYNALFERSLALVYICDLEGRVIDANEAILHRLGYSRKELRSLDLTLLLSEDQLPLAFKTIQEIRETGNQKNPTEFRLRHKDGTWVFVETTGSAVFSEGNVVAIQVIGNDITKRKRTEDKTRQLLADLDRSNKELEQFAYVASHDLQEPLRMVSSYTQLLARRYKGRLDADADDFIAYAVDGAYRMQRLINDLLAYSRVGTRGKEFEPTDCSAFFDQAVANLKVPIEESGAVVDRGLLPTVMADKLQLGQLLQNLIGNAIKYHGDEPPRVHVSAEQKGNEWVFSVRDNGIGIDPQFADRIFVIFQRLHNREKYPGTGIGLAICKKIVERHGGRIWLESQVGSGATFYFTMPIGKKPLLQSVWVEKRARPRRRP